jgi:hypothetical protein
VIDGAVPLGWNLFFDRLLLTHPAHSRASRQGLLSKEVSVMESTLEMRPHSMARRTGASFCALLAAAGLLALPIPASGQASLSFGTQRPFVVGIIPVVGASGAVGGVSIDADGVVARSDLETRGKLREARLAALKGVDSDIQSASPIRKISLRRL